MAPKKKESKIREKINQIYEENELANLMANKNRARSITVGTAFGGAVEISMRGDYHDLWAVIQPVEAVELIEQLASGIGLQIAMRPRQDFATWRGWNVDAQDRYWAGAAEWQIEQASTAHRKMLELEKEQKYLLPNKIKRKKSKKETLTAEEDFERLQKEHKLQQKIQDDLCQPALKNVKNIRKDVKTAIDKRADELKQNKDE
jgi:hypothetical protein